MRTRVHKWGNSLAVRIPKPFASEAGLEDNSIVEMSLTNRELVVTPVAPPSCTLDELLARVNKKNRHRGIDTGAPVGDEVW